MSITHSLGDQLPADILTCPPTHLQPLLTRLIAAQAITQFQAEWIEATWPNLDADAFAHPYLQTVREHTRAYLEKAC